MAAPFLQMITSRHPSSPEEVSGGMNDYWIAAVWMGMALLASLLSIRLGISVALVEILVGAVVGNVPALTGLAQQTPFTNFLATVGSAVLTFLAGAEIDPDSLRRHWRASLVSGWLVSPRPSRGRCCSPGMCWIGHGLPPRFAASR